MKKFYFPKIERPGFGKGGRFASFHKNDVVFGNAVYYSEKKMFFKISHLPKNVKKCPRDAKTDLVISGVGEG